MIPIKGMKTAPEYHEDALMMCAFAGLVRFALGKDEILKQYKTETGVDMRKVFPKCSLDAMIDEACGHDIGQDVAAFADWVNINLWGKEGSDEAETEGI